MTEHPHSDQLGLALLLGWCAGALVGGVISLVFDLDGTKAVLFGAVAGLAFMGTCVLLDHWDERA